MILAQSPNSKKKLMHTQIGVKDLSINTWDLAQFDRHGTGNTTITGLRWFL